MSSTAVPQKPITHGNSNTFFGSFPDPVLLDPNLKLQKVYTRDKFVAQYLANIPRNILEHINDLRVANYAEEDILLALNLVAIPPKLVLYELLGRCSRC